MVSMWHMQTVIMQETWMIGKALLVMCFYLVGLCHDPLKSNIWLLYLL